MIQTCADWTVQPVNVNVLCVCVCVCVCVCGSVQPCGGQWTRLEALVNASGSPAALQLRLTAPATDRNWGGAVWVGAASIVAES